MLSRALSIALIMVLGVAAGCQKSGDSDANAATNDKTKQVTVEITGMS